MSLRLLRRSRRLHEATQAVFPVREPFASLPECFLAFTKPSQDRQGAFSRLRTLREAARTVFHARKAFARLPASVVMLAKPSPAPSAEAARCLMSSLQSKAAKPSATCYSYSQDFCSTESRRKGETPPLSPPILGEGPGVGSLHCYYQASSWSSPLLS